LDSRCQKTWHEHATKFLISCAKLEGVYGFVSSLIGLILIRGGYLHVVNKDGNIKLMFAHDLGYPIGNALGHYTFCYRIWLEECHKYIDPSRLCELSRRKLMASNSVKT
jgi:hypothetical protein